MHHLAWPIQVQLHQLPTLLGMSLTTITNSQSPNLVYIDPDGKSDAS